MPATQKRTYARYTREGLALLGKMIRLGHVFGSLKHHVFEQVGETTPSRILVTAADVIPHIHDLFRDSG